LVPEKKINVDDLLPVRYRQGRSTAPLDLTRAAKSISIDAPALSGWGAVTARTRYWETAPAAYNAMGALNRYLAATKIDREIRLLVEILVSRINGCSYCIDRHTKAALGEGVDQKRIDCVLHWQSSPHYSARERAALGWAHALTHVAETHAPQALHDAVRAHFDETDMIDLTLIISVMNAWNRMAIAFDRQPTSALPDT